MKEKMKEKMLHILSVIKKKKKLLLCIAGAVAALIIALVIATAIKASIVRKAINEEFDSDVYYIEKTVLEFESDGYGDFFAFKDGQFASEYAGSSIHYGDITAFGDYKVEVSLIDDYVSVTKDGSPSLFMKFKQGKIELYTEKYEITLEEIDRLRKIALCGEHEWEETVTSVATCTKSGEKEKVCKKCGLIETKTYTVEHEYKNDVCELCGREKPRPKTALKGDTWYTHTEITALKVRNISVTQATAKANGRGVIVSGYHFCAECSTLAQVSSMHVPEFGYDSIRVYSCDVCGHVTTVMLHLE